jgi:hypothetical protein
MKKNMKNKSSMDTTEVFKEVVINSHKEVGINNISVGTNSISIGTSNISIGNSNIHEDKNIEKVSENNLNERVTKLTNIISEYEIILNKLESIEIKSDLNCLNKDQYLIGEMLQHCLQNGYEAE